MGAEGLAENTPNAPNLSAQFVCPSPRVLDFNEKRLHWAFLVPAHRDTHLFFLCKAFSQTNKKSKKRNQQATIQNFVEGKLKKR